MSTVTGRAALFTGGTTIDTRVCAEIGAQLTRIRTERGLTVAEVGDRLLLSPRQVRALEGVDLAAFHNAAFYMTGLRKYAAFAGIDETLVARASTSEPLELVPGHADTGPAVEDRPARSPWSLVGLGLAVVALAAVVYFRPQLTPPSMPVSPSGPAGAAAATPPEASSATAPEPAPLPPPSQEPGTTSQATGTAGDATPSGAAISSEPPGFGAVRVSRATWLFLRYADNTSVERPLADGETAVFEKEPVYLALGSPDVELTVGGRRVNVLPFVVNGQLRVRAPDFRSLLQADDAPPVQADAPPADDVPAR